MDTTLRTSILKPAAIRTIFAVLCSAVPFSLVMAQEVLNNDYFASPRDSSSLLTVEKYHLTAENFGAKFRAGQFNYALEDLKFVLRYFPNHPKALYLTGVIAKVTKRPSLSIAHYQKALDLFPQYALTHAQYGAYLADIGLVNEGIAELEQAVKIDPNLAPAYGWLGKAYNKIGKWELGRQAADRAKELEVSGKLSGRVPQNKEQSGFIQEGPEGEDSKIPLQGESR